MDVNISLQSLKQLTMSIKTCILSAPYTSKPHFSNRLLTLKQELTFAIIPSPCNHIPHICSHVFS
jgi:hypothetical protein